MRANAKIYKGFIIITFLTLSCSRGSQEGSQGGSRSLRGSHNVQVEKALEICDCYAWLHSKAVMVDSEEELQQETEKCNQLFKKAINELKTEEEKEQFWEAYRSCQ